MSGLAASHYAVGKRVYRGGSNSPNGGVVSKGGYKVRDRKLAVKKAAQRRLQMKGR